MYMQYYTGTGDVYVDCGMLQGYLHKHHLSQEYVFISTGEAGAAIAKLFDIKTIRSVGRYEARDLVHFFRFMPENMLALHMLHYHDHRMYTSIAWWLMGLHGICFFDMYRWTVFCGLPSNDFVLPHFSDNPQFTDRVFDALHLIPGKTVVLSPYSHSLEMQERSFWESIVRQLKGAGYTVCTNSTGEHEPPVPGTEAIGIPYTELKLFLERAGCFMGARSGLCEIISAIHCKKVVLYPTRCWPEEGALCLSAKEIFSLSQFPFSTAALELEYSEKDTAIAQILHYIKEQEADENSRN